MSADSPDRLHSFVFTGGSFEVDQPSLPLLISTNNLPVHTYQPTIFVTLTTPHFNQQPPSTNISIINNICNIYNSSYQPTTCVALTIFQKSLMTTSQVCLSTNLCHFYTGRYRVFSFLTGFPDFQYQSGKRVAANQRYIFKKFSMEKRYEQDFLVDPKPQFQNQSSKR